MVFFKPGRNQGQDVKSQEIFIFCLGLEFNGDPDYSGIPIGIISKFKSYIPWSFSTF